MLQSLSKTQMISWKIFMIFLFLLTKNVHNYSQNFKGTYNAGFHCHAIKNKFETTIKTTNRRLKKKKISQSLSSVWCFICKLFAETFCSNLYGSVCVPLRGTNMAAAYHRKHLELNFAMLAATLRLWSSVPSHKHHFLCLKCSTAKNWKEMPYFQTFCHCAQLDVTSSREPEYWKCPVFKTNDAIDPKTCQETNV